MTPPTIPHYRDFVRDAAFADTYRDYQRRYAHTIRESDRVIIEIVREIVSARPPATAAPRILDAGCSTGNLLLHLRREIPGIDLSGGELMSSALEECRGNPELAGITFEELDVLALDRAGVYDIVVVNAVFYMFEDEELKRALRSIAQALVPGGALVAFDLFHPFEQSLVVHEETAGRPAGLILHLRPYSVLRACMADAGLGDVEIRPFRIPIDLPHPQEVDDIRSYTIRSDDGNRLLFRGALAQPWCHVVARKPNA